MIKELKNKKAPGEDGVINELIKYGGEVIYKFIADFFNKIISEVKIPEAWKVAKIILIFKKSEKHSIKNYVSHELLSV